MKILTRKQQDKIVDDVTNVMIYAVYAKGDNKQLDDNDIILLDSVIDITKSVAGEAGTKKLVEALNRLLGEEKDDK